MNGLGDTDSSRMYVLELASLCSQEPRGNCNPMYDTYCLINYQNGHCDNGCDNADCDWDGLDCDNSPAQVLPGKLYIIVLMSVEEFRSNMVSRCNQTYSCGVISAAWTPPIPSSPKPFAYLSLPHHPCNPTPLGKKETLWCKMLKYGKPSTPTKINEES